MIIYLGPMNMGYTMNIDWYSCHCHDRAFNCFISLTVTGTVTVVFTIVGFNDEALSPRCSKCSLRF